MERRISCVCAVATSRFLIVDCGSCAAGCVSVMADLNGEPRVDRVEKISS